MHLHGYVGFDSGINLAEKVRRKPYCLILFDEIEKAHYDVLNILLQIFEDGILTESTGRTVDFKNCIIIMTSNIGAELISKKNLLGFNNIDIESNEKKEVLDKLKKELRPEFLNRIDEIVVFNKLRKNDLNLIIDKFINELEKKLEDKNIKIEMKDDAKEYIVSLCVKEDLGARPIRRKVQNLIENKIAEEMLKGIIQEGDLINIRLNDNKIEIENSLKI